MVLVMNDVVFPGFRFAPSGLRVGECPGFRCAPSGLRGANAVARMKAEGRNPGETPRLQPCTSRS